MAYSNLFLRDFRPVFLGILREKQIRPEWVELNVIDDEGDGEGMFEPVSVREVLDQLAEDLNFLTIYTERPAYFYEFTEIMYEETGLIVTLFPKEAIGQAGNTARVRCGRPVNRSEETGAELILDFEWEGDCRASFIGPGKYYIPIHKKPWRRGENLDIAIPIGYNTVIIRAVQEPGRRPVRDRFEEAFYDL